MMQRINFNCLLVLLTATALLSCRKGSETENGTYTVSDTKMIGMAANNWSGIEPQLQSKRGYEYSTAADNLSNVLKGTVSLPAVDDSNRTVDGRILLNIVPDNTVSYAAFDTNPVAQTAADALMLNYNRETLQTLTGISSSIGEVIEAGRGGNTTVDVVLSKLTSAQTADQLAINYKSGPKSLTMAVFRQTDGRYIFSYRGTR